MLTPEVQALFVEEAAELFVSIAGGWGPMGMTHIRLVTADDATLTGALRKAWTLRMEKNTRSGARSLTRVYTWFMSRSCGGASCSNFVNTMSALTGDR